MVSINLPIRLRFDSEQGRLISSAVLIVVYILGYSLLGWANRIWKTRELESLIANRSWLLLMILAISVIVLLSSYKVSIKVMKKKEY